MTFHLCLWAVIALSLSMLVGGYIVWCAWDILGGPVLDWIEDWRFRRKIDRGFNRAWKVDKDD